MAEMLCPARRAGAALSNLRHALTSLRRALGDAGGGSDLLIADRNTVALAGTDVWVDIVELERLASTSPADEDAARSWERAASLWRGPLLDDIRIRAGAGWEEWQLVTSERARRHVIEALTHLVEHHERRADIDAALRFAQRLADVDPWDERAHRSVMRLHALRGDPAGARAHYEALRARLAAELGGTPSEETTALADQIRAGAVRSAPVTSDVSYPGFLARPPRVPPRQPFVGQAAALDFLEANLEAARGGEGRVVVLAGEAGSGKTMLATEFARRCVHLPGLLSAFGRCNAYAGLGDPYLPFREVLGSLTGDVEAAVMAGSIEPEAARRLWAAIPISARLLLERSPSLIGVMVNGALLVERVERAAPDVPWIDDLRRRVATVAARPPSPERMQPALFDEFVSVVDGIAAVHPVLVVIDDLQWADAGSVALLWHLARRLGGRRLMMLCLYRPEDIAPARGGAHPLRPVLDELRTLAPDGFLELTSDPAFVDAFLDSMPNDFDESFRDRLAQHTGGHPLFTVEFVRGMQDRAEIRRTNEGLWAVGEGLDWHELPTRVESVISRRIGRLPDETRRDLVASAVQGEEFIAEAVGIVRGDPDTAARLAVEGRSENRLIEPVGATRTERGLATRYRFRHIMFQQYLYDRLDRGERIRLHERTGRALEDIHRGDAGLPVVDLAHHFDEAGLVEPAIAYARLGGQRAVRMSANEEAIRLFQRALELQATLPESPERDARELELLAALQAPVMAVRGYTAPESEDAGRRVRQLCERLDPSPVSALALTGLAHFLTIKAAHEDALDVSQQVAALGEQLGDSALRCVGIFMVGYEEMWMGRVRDGFVHLGQAIDMFDPERHAWLSHALGMAVGPEAAAWGALNAMFRGRPGVAHGLADESIALARRLGVPFSLCHALDIAGIVVPAMAGDHHRALGVLDEARELAHEEHFPFWSAAIELHRGMSVGHAGDPDAGIAAMERGMAAWSELGVEAFRGWYLAELADLEALRGRLERGLEIVDDELARARRIREGLSEVCLLVQRGRLEAAMGRGDTAIGTLAGAIDSARTAGAALLELRAATSLAEVLADRGRTTEAKERLASAVAAIEEGGYLPHLDAATAVLDRL